MRPTYHTKRALAEDLLLIAFVAGTIGIAVKFTTFFDNWVFFPKFPNILDSAFLIASVLYLAYRAIRWRH